MDYMIFNMHTDISTCSFTGDGDMCVWRGCVCTDTRRESALKVDPGRKILCCTRYLSLRQWNASLMLCHLTPELHPHPIHYVPCSPSHSTHIAGCFIPSPGCCKAGEGMGCETERHLLMTGLVSSFTETNTIYNFVKLWCRGLLKPANFITL